MMVAYIEGIFFLLKNYVSEMTSMCSLYKALLPHVTFSEQCHIQGSIAIVCKITKLCQKSFKLFFCYSHSHMSLTFKYISDACHGWQTLLLYSQVLSLSFLFCAHGLSSLLSSLTQFCIVQSSWCIWLCPLFLFTCSPDFIHKWEPEFTFREWWGERSRRDQWGEGQEYLGIFPVSYWKLKNMPSSLPSEKFPFLYVRWYSEILGTLDI